MKEIFTAILFTALCLAIIVGFYFALAGFGMFIGGLFK